MKDWRENLAINLKTWREAYGWSQEKLSEKAECSKSVVRDLEIKKGSASLDMVSKLAAALNVSVETLLKSGETPTDLSQTQIDKLAESALTISILDILHKRVSRVPEEVFLYAKDFDEDDWKLVLGAMRGVINSKRKKEKAKQA